MRRDSHESAFARGAASPSACKIRPYLVTRRTVISRIGG
jgi:hypothetical protein